MTECEKAARLRGEMMRKHPLLAVAPLLGLGALMAVVVAVAAA